MKVAFLTFCLTLFGCVTSAQTTSKPTGEEIFRALIGGSHMKLAQEPLCNMSSVSMGMSGLTLGEHLSTVLSTSYDSTNTTVISSECGRSKHDSDGKVIEIWDCKLQVNENSDTGDFISASTIAFGIYLDELILVPGSLRCF